MGEALITRRGGSVKTGIVNIDDTYYSTGDSISIIIHEIAGYDNVILIAEHARRPADSEDYVCVATDFYYCDGYCWLGVIEKEYAYEQPHRERYGGGDHLGDDGDIAYHKSTGKILVWTGSSEMWNGRYKYWCW